VRPAEARVEHQQIGHVAGVALQQRLGVIHVELGRSFRRLKERPQGFNGLERASLIAFLRFLTTPLREPAAPERAPEGGDGVAVHVIEILGQAEDAGQGVQVVEAGVGRASPPLDLGLPSREEVATADLIHAALTEVGDELATLAEE